MITIIQTRSQVDQDGESVAKRGRCPPPSTIEFLIAVRNYTTSLKRRNGGPRLPW
jgi:hypothetical protein